MTGHETSPPAPPRRRVRRPLLIVSLGLLAAAVIGSFLLGGSGPEPASVSWSPSPAAADPGSAAVQGCAGGGARVAEVLILEQRGITTLIVGTDDADQHLTCLVVGTAEESTSSSISTPRSDSAQVASDQLISWGQLLTQSDPAALDDPDTAYQLAVAGRAGGDVVSVTLRTSAGEVEATVDNEAFAAWWPVADESAMDEPVVAVATLSDGSTRTVDLSEE